MFSYEENFTHTIVCDGIKDTSYFCTVYLSLVSKLVCFIVFFLITRTKHEKTDEFLNKLFLIYVMALIIIVTLPAEANPQIKHCLVKENLAKENKLLSL